MSSPPLPRKRSKKLVVGLASAVTGLAASAWHLMFGLGHFVIFDTGTWFSPILYFGRFAAPSLSWISTDQAEMLVVTAVVTFGVAQFAIFLIRRRRRQRKTRQS
ncbi:hypothetical protein [Halosegnis marinus]|uniref:Uncharacterized protein n=1 Tax=Halosegnis marinus TaxID=3034023 RepID=A0ABD5ZSZ4_9EURY|nr:hypothetical protein [Halosegnis sp. DT85]